MKTKTEREELVEALQDCADSMHTLIQLHRLKPEDNMTLQHARALLARIRDSAEHSSP